jgi:hypothetical protein
MNETFKDELESIKAETPTSVKADPASLLYGIIFVALGALLLALENVGFGLLFILVGGIGVAAGVATFVWKSPRVKVLQAVDSFLVALLFLAFMAAGGHGILQNPLVCLAIAAFMTWSGFGDLREYRRLKKVDAERAAKQA